MKAAWALILAAVGAAAQSKSEQKLEIARAVFAQTEDGPAVATGTEFVPSDSAFFSCLVEGYSKSDIDEIALTYRIEAKDPQGILLQPPTIGKVEAKLAPEDKDWKPKLRAAIVVPPMISSGEMQVSVSVKDERTGATAESHVKFTVTGRDIPPSDSLAVGGFRFLRGEDDPKPLKVPAYRPGDTLWARFYMTGYKLGKNNEFDIQYGVTVLRSDGTTAYSEPNAASLKNQPFYPQRYQPGELSLNFAKDQALGEYTIVVSVKDNIGGQTVESRQKFSVE